MKKIALIEPYFSGSHKDFALGLKNHSSHQIEIFSMKGRNWKWRMHGGAITLAQDFMNSNFEADIILSTSLLDLTTFLSLTRKKSARTPVIHYFHENQITYPKSKKDTDLKEKRDDHYGFINIASALSADLVLFNSEFHKMSFLSGARIFLKQMRDYPLTETIDEISMKSQVLPLGVNFNYLETFKIPKFQNKLPLIVWNHRWEYDKNFCDFLDIILEVKKDHQFELAILGDCFKKIPQEFKKAQELLEENIIHFGYVKEPSDYAKWLWKADIALTTSNHDFFGLSVVETLFTGCLPILPNRLSYPEHMKDEKSLYNSKAEAIQILSSSLTKYPHIQVPKNHVLDYSWEKMILKYDQLFERITNE